MKMKHVVWMAVAAMILVGLAGCKPASGGQKNKGKDRELPAELAAAYREDAARLAVRELLTTTQTGENAADIPQGRIDYFYGLLSKVYWICKDVDSIPDLSGIHTLKNPSLRQIMVVLDKTSPFKENWSKGVTLTNNLYLNQMISKYKITIKNYRESSLGPTMIMETGMDVNTKELAFLIKNIETIRHAEAEGIVGDGNDITYGSDGKNAMAIKYSIGEGDCPSGCINRKSWVFYILTDGSISFMGTRGKIPVGMEPPQ
jgi:hypothetical protein